MTKPRFRVSIQWLSSCILTLGLPASALGQQSRVLPLLSLEPRPSLTINDAAPDGSWALVGLTGARAIRTGGFAVPSTTEIHRFDAQGRHLGAIGRVGEGPGEFSYISGIAECPGDRYLVSDVVQRRLTLLVPPPGKPLVKTFLQLGIANNVVPIACEGGLGYFITNKARPATWPHGTLYQDTLTVLRGALDLSVRDTLLRLAGASTFDGLIQPFGAHGQVVINGRSIASGFTGDSVIVIAPLAGGPKQRVVVHGLPVIALSAQMFAKKAAQSEKETPPAIWTRELKDIFATVPRPSHLPLWDQLLLDNSARLWVREYRSPLAPVSVPNRWHVVSATGAALGLLVLQEGNDLVGVRGSDAVIIHRTTDDTESLEVRRIRGL